MRQGVHRLNGVGSVPLIGFFSPCSYAKLNSIIVGLLVLFFTQVSNANNIQVSNVQLTGEVQSGGYVQVQFDLTWENSWRLTSAPGNWDAAWVFVKYRVGTGDWKHAWLNDLGHSSGSGTGTTMEVGLKNDKLAFDAATNPGIGVMVFRNHDGSGTYATTGMQLRWNHTANGVPPGASVEVRVFAIEMVLIPEGPFWLGDSTSFQTFRQTGSNTPYQVTTTGAALKCQPGGGDDAQFSGAGIWVDGDGGISKSAATQTDMNPDYPTGFRAYYSMKYEISQGQYRDFLNTLTRVQQNARTGLDISGTSPIPPCGTYLMSECSQNKRNYLRCSAVLPASGPIEVYMDADDDGIKNEGHDGEWVACNWLNWGDGAAYLDWSGLRPLTEMEYEKVCRGPNNALHNEYAWGTAGIADLVYNCSALSNPNENISGNYSTSGGNALYATTSSCFDGPARVGIFSGNALNSGRVSSGSGYYGNMELTGNLEEWFITMGNLLGRSFTGLHGDGELNPDGAADVAAWPGSGTNGLAIRGGNWVDLARLQVSGRSAAVIFSGTNRTMTMGMRGARSRI